MTALFNPLSNKLTSDTYVKALGISLLGAITLAIASQISIPLQPVPLTFQSITAVFLGLVLGPRLAASAIGLYLLMGILGAPVFANWHAGMPIMMGPTGGYLLSFVPAAMVSGFLTQAGLGKNVVGVFIAGLVGCAIIFAGGFLVLSTFIGAEKAYLVGVKLFVLPEAVKLLALALFVPRCWK
jgi:biotin transport system substrate-specific component